MSRSVWEEMTTYAKDLHSTIKASNEAAAKRESEAKAKEYIHKASESLARKTSEPSKKQEVAKEKKDTSIVGIISNYRKEQREKALMD